MPRPQPISHWAGLNLDRPRVMGILNVTPDSFSDGGERIDPQRRHRRRPGDGRGRRGHHRRRRREHPARCRAGSARCGAGSGPAGDPGPGLASVYACRSIHATPPRCGRRSTPVPGSSTTSPRWPMIRWRPRVVAEHACPVVLMHMRGTPATMNAQAVYDNVVAEVRAELELPRGGGCSGGDAAANRSPSTPASASPSARRTRGRCCAACRNLPASVIPLLVGVSRKSFIGAVCRRTRPWPAPGRVARRRAVRRVARCVNRARA